jgi:hypothetical protein
VCLSRPRPLRFNFGRSSARLLGSRAVYGCRTPQTGRSETQGGAQEHYEALLAETKKRGGPTTPTYEAIADWTGRYAHPGLTPNDMDWYRGHNHQIPTWLSLLTPE